MSKEDKPCVGVPADEDNEFDECQQEYIIHQVWVENSLRLFKLLIIKLKRDVNCRVPWVMGSDLEICDQSLAQKASDIYFEAQKSAICLQPCCTTEVDINNKFTTRMEDGSTVMELRFPPTIKNYVEIEVYGLVSMLAGVKWISIDFSLTCLLLSELSGYIGMFLGISFFDLRLLLNMVLDYIKKKTSVETLQTKVTPY